MASILDKITDAWFGKNKNEKDSEESDLEIIAKINKRIKDQEPVLRDFHQQWFINAAMRRGNQNLLADSFGIQFNPERDDNESVRMVINKLNRYHQRRVAKIVSELPRLQVLPNSSQDEDQDLARRGTKIIEWVFAEEDFRIKALELIEEAVDLSDSFLHVYWDPEKGPPIESYQKHEGEITGEEPYKIDDEGYILDDEGHRIDEKLTMGDVAIDHISAFDIVNDGVSKTLDKDTSWIAIRKRMPLQKIKMRWPDKGHKVKADSDTQDDRSYYQRQLMAMAGGATNTYGNESKSSEPEATVVYYFESPTEKYKDGRKLTFSGNVKLDSDTLDEHKMIPLVKFTDIKVTGSFWGTSTIAQCLPLQRGLNRTWSQVLENGNNFGNIKLVITKNSGVASIALDDSANEIIEVNEGTDIHQLQPASLPAHVVNMFDRWDRAFEDVTGQSEVSNASVPAGVTSGRAILALQEQDDTQLAPTKIRLHESYKRVGQMILMLYAQYQDEDRTFRITSEDGYDIEKVVVSKEEIESMRKDVTIQNENIIAAHWRMQQDQVMGMYDKGLFGDPKEDATRKRVLNLLEFGHVADVFNEMNLDEAQADLENKQFLDKEDLVRIENPRFNLFPGEPQFVLSLPVYDFEDHAIHLRKHNNFRKSPVYKQMSQELKKGIDRHCEVHMMKLKTSAPNGSMQGMGVPPPPPPAGIGAPPIGAVPPPPIPMPPPPANGAQGQPPQPPQEPIPAEPPPPIE